MINAIYKDGTIVGKPDAGYPPVISLLKLMDLKWKEKK
jgi:hypothetical protein